jgi:hypothetical protein
MKHPLDFCRGEIATVSNRQHGCKRSSILAGFRSLTARNLSRGREGHASPADPIVNVAQIHLLKTALKVKDFQKIVPVAVCGPVAVAFCRFCCYLLSIGSKQQKA